MSLFESIREVLKAEGGLKAREISARIANRYQKKVSKKEINSVLYGYENYYFIVNGEFRWSLIDDR